MTWLKEMFHTEKPIIGLLHLEELPGDPYYKDGTKMQDVIALAKRDLIALQNGGVDGVLITNEFSLPYQRKVSQVNTNAIAMVVGAIRDMITVPYGVEAIYDGDATIELCAATDAQFTRCLFTGVWGGDLGLIDRNIADTIRLKHYLRIDDLKLFHFINSEDEVYLNNRSLASMAKSLVGNVQPDCFVVAGSGAGNGPAMANIEEVVENGKGTPVFCGTGCRKENVASILEKCNGAFVGTTFKVDGKLRERIDEARVKAFMDEVKNYRGNQ